MNSFRIQKPVLWQSMPFYKKIQFYARSLTPAFAPYVDKLAAKQIVKRMCPELRIARVIRVLTGPNDIYSDDIVSCRMVKSAHASRWNVQLTPGMDLTDLRDRLTSFYRPFRVADERQYDTIKPTLFIEEMIEDAVRGPGLPAIVYMVHCVYGRPMFFRTEVDNSRNTYTLDWRPIYPETSFIPRPPCEEMVRMAAKLSAPFEYVRIDFFLGKDGIYFSEFTFTPAAGSNVLPPEADRLLATTWSR